MPEALTKHVRYSSQRDFSEDENKTWCEIIRMQRSCRPQQLYPIFDEGLKILGMDSDRIPDLNQVNRKLKSISGWEGVFVEGLESGETFYRLLSEKKFPIGNFIRDRQNLNYTPEPDIVHDFYGHIPFYANREYADFNERFGKMAIKYISQPQKFRQFERFFWFTCEFGLIETQQGRKVFGAGIASSISECKYALSNVPEVLPFDIDRIRHQEFRIDEMQKRLFVIKNEEQLYSSLKELENHVQKS